MTVYAVAGEADTFNLGAASSFAQTAVAGRFEANLSRGAMLVTQAASELTVKFGATLSSFWLHMRMYQASFPAATQNYFFIKNAAGTEDEYRILINPDSTWTIQRFKAGAYNTLGSTPGAVLLDAAGDIDINIVRAVTGGIFQIYKNGTSIYLFSGDTDTANPPGLLYIQGMTTNGRELDISQIIIADESTLGWKVATLAPSANGANTGWTHDYTTINEFVYDNTNYIETNATGIISTFPNPGINAAYATYNVKAVVVAARVSNDAGSAVADLQFVVRTGGTNYTSANAGVVKDGTEQSVQSVFNTNPNTSAVWTQAQVNGLEVGVKSV